MKFGNLCFSLVIYLIFTPYISFSYVCFLGSGVNLQSKELQVVCVFTNKNFFSEIRVIIIKPLIPLKFEKRIVISGRQLYISLQLTFMSCCSFNRSSILKYWWEAAIKKTEKWSDLCNCFRPNSYNFLKFFVCQVLTLFCPRHWNTGLSSRVSLTSKGEGASHWPASHPIFSYWVG